MSIRNGLFSSESVSGGHPDKPADRIADAVLDAFPSPAVEAEGVSPARGADIVDALRGEFDHTPAGIIRYLDLQRPICSPTAACGHFGRDDLDLPREADVTPSRAGSSGEPGGR